MKEETKYILALSRIDGVGPILGKQLIAYCGGASAVFAATLKDLADIPSIGRKVAGKILNADPEVLAEAECTFIEKNNIQAVSFLDKDYPRRLKHYDDSPMMLYYQGTQLLNPARTIGIVGTRTPTEYGMLNTEKLIEELQSYGVVIVSGMAYGIDSVAHRKAVELNIPTIGVLGHGLDRLYPSTNRELGEKMKQQGGLLTEFVSGTNPDRENFPMRNRIIAGISDAVIVMESRERGGSIITAELANQYNKDVFALPGRVDDKHSQGCNKLIKIHKASLLESAKDLAYILRWEKTNDEAKQQSLFVELNPEETIIIEAIRHKKNAAIDVLHHDTGMSMTKLSSVLLQLEFKGIVRSLPGKRYIIR